MTALDAMPVKRFIANALERDGEYCTLGVLGKAKGVSLVEFGGDEIDCDQADDIAKLFNLAPAMVREIEYENDEGFYGTETPEQRWARMRGWVAGNIIKKEEHDEANDEADEH